MNEREEARKRAEVMLAYADGAEIEYKQVTSIDWIEHCGSPGWQWKFYDYRVKPAAPKTVKYYCYTDGSQLYWVIRGVTLPLAWKAIPSEDKEVTLP